MHVNDFFKGVRFYYIQTLNGWRLDTSVGNFSGDISDYIPFSFDHSTLHSISRPFGGEFKIVTKDEHILEMRKYFLHLNKLKKGDDDN